MVRIRATRPGALALAFLISWNADAAEPSATGISSSNGGDRAPPPFEGALKTGVTLSVADNTNAYGATPGTTLSFGYSLAAQAIVRRGKHEWRNFLGYTAQFTKVPMLSQIIVSGDNLGATSTYLYHVVPIFGPFVELSANTVVYRSVNYTPGPAPYLIVHPDGQEEQTVASAFKLTDPIAPTFLLASAGPFAHPLSTPELQLEVRASLTGFDALAKNQFMVVDNLSFPGITVAELADARVLGGGATVGAWGVVLDQMLMYRVQVDGIGPFAVDGVRSGDRRVMWRIEGGASIKVQKWVSLDYSLHTLFAPQVVDRWIIQQMLLFTVGMAVGEHTGP